MRKPTFIFRLCTAFASLFAAQTLSSAHAAIIVKANNTDALNLASSWTNGVAPGANDIATWDGTTAANTVLLGADLAWQGMAVDATHTAGTIEISTGNTLTLGSSGITRIGNVILNLRCDLAFAADQVWDIGGNLDFSPRGTINTHGHQLSYSTASSIQNFGYFTGGGAVTITKGALRFSSGSTSGGGASPFTVFPGATLNYDVHTGSKVLAKSVTLIGGTLRSMCDSGNHAADTITEALTIDRGGSTVTLTTHSTRNLRLTPAELVRSNNGVVLFRSTGLGVNTVDSLTANSGNITFGTAPTLVGAGGVGGSTTNSILVGAYGDTTSTGNGFTATGGLVTYDSTYGIRLLNWSTECTNTITDGQTQLDNVRLVNSSGTPKTITLASPTTLNSLSFNVDATVSPITITGEALTLNSGTMYARSVSPATTGAEMTLNSTLNLNGREGVVLFSTAGSSNGAGGAKLQINGGVTNDGGNGLTIYGAGGVFEFNGTTENTYTGATTLNSGTLQLRKTVNNYAIPGDLVVNKGDLIVGISHQVADSGSITINNGTVYFADSTSTGSATSDSFSNLIMRASGKISYASGRNNTINVLGSANISGVVMPSARGGKFNVHKQTVLHSGGSILVDFEYDNPPNLYGKMTLQGGLVITNIQQGTYTVAEVRSDSSKYGARLAFADDLQFIANETNLDPAVIATTSKTYPGMVLLNGTRTFNIGDGAASTDFVIQPMITDDGATIGALVKVGAGTLALDGASTFTGGTTVNEGTLAGNGSLASDLTVASGATLAPGTPDAVGTFTVNADVDFEAGSILDIDLVGETADLLVVSGAVTGTVSVPVAQDLTEGEWKVMTAASFDGSFVPTNPRLALYTRNNGTELWLTKKLATTIIVR